MRNCDDCGQPTDENRIDSFAAFEEADEAHAYLCWRCSLGWPASAWGPWAPMVGGNRTEAVMAAIARFVWRVKRSLSLRRASSAQGAARRAHAVFAALIAERNAAEVRGDRREAAAFAAAIDSLSRHPAIEGRREAALDALFADSGSLV